MKTMIVPLCWLAGSLVWVIGLLIFFDKHDEDPAVTWCKEVIGIHERFEDEREQRDSVEKGDDTLRGE